MPVTDHVEFAPLDDDELIRWLVRFVVLVGSLNAVAGNQDRTGYVDVRRRLTVHADKVSSALLAARRPA